MVGDLVGSGGAQECRVMGETPNLAARLQGNRRRARSVESRFEVLHPSG